MSHVNRSSRALAGAAIAANLMFSAYRSNDPSEPIVIAVSAFEILGDAQPTMVERMGTDLAGSSLRSTPVGTRT